MTEHEHAEPDYGTTADADYRMRREQQVEREHRIGLEAAERLSEHRPVRPDPKPAPRTTRRVAGRTAAQEGRHWRDAVLDRDSGCVVHSNPADCAEGWHAHHVVPQQVLRRERPD